MATPRALANERRKHACTHAAARAGRRGREGGNEIEGEREEAERERERERERESERERLSLSLLGVSAPGCLTGGRLLGRVTIM